MTYWYEWASIPNARSGIMVDEPDLQKFIQSKASSGFRSVFGFHPDHAKMIKARGHSKGFKEFPCYADKIVIDIDTGDEGLKTAEELVVKSGLQYRLYSSGGKGYHFIIPCEPLYSYHTPYSHMKYVESLGLETDFSVYRHNSLISLEGRIHPKTKKPKAFIKEVEGRTAVVPLIQPPVFFAQKPDDYSYIADGFGRASDLVDLQPREGERYMSLWYCVKCLYDGGLSKEAAEELATLINDSWENPKEPEEISRLLEDCYG